MLNALTTKLEVDVMQQADLDGAMQQAIIHRLPAIVIHPLLVAPALSTRIKRRGQFKIIATIDWPRGESYGMTKLRGMTKEMLEVDGYEIMMTGGKTEIENRNEAKTLADFIRQRINPRLEVRFVLGCATRPEAETVRMAAAMAGVQAPALIRTDIALKAQVTKANQKVHTATVQALRAACSVPIKVSGNIDSVRIIAGLTAMERGPQRFAVSPQQLAAIIKDVQAQPDELHRLLASGDTEDAEDVENLAIPAR